VAEHRTVPQDVSVETGCSKFIVLEKMFYSDNLLLSVLARSCKERAVADAYNISVFDLLHLDSSGFKNVFWDYFILAFEYFLVSVFIFQCIVCVFFSVSFSLIVLLFLLYRVL